MLRSRSVLILMPAKWVTCFSFQGLGHAGLQTMLFPGSCRMNRVRNILLQLQSAKMRLGFFPPNSKDNFLNMGAATEAIR